MAGEVTSGALSQWSVTGVIRDQCRAPNAIPPTTLAATTTTRQSKVRRRQDRFLGAGVGGVSIVEELAASVDAGLPL